jgi:hypothetical protein
MTETERATVLLIKTTRQLYGFNFDEESNETLVNVMLNRVLPLYSDDKYIYQKRYYYKKKFTKLLEYARN